MSLISSSGGLRLAVVGCTHGALDIIYDTVSQLELENDYVVDAILCCGDFQAIRNTYDLETMVTPNKYRKMEDFWRYYKGDKVAPKLTIFIGGNHEAVAHNRELYYGGWVAPNIYFLGYSGLINVGGLRIGGFSGIYDHKFFRSGHHELTPYGKNDLHSAMYVRLYELWKLAHLTGHLDALISHDWPEYIAYFGSVDTLLRNKPFFKTSLDENTLGCEAYLALMKLLKPTHWFSGHMHTHFTARVCHASSSLNASTSSSSSKTKDLQTLLTSPQSVDKSSSSASSSTSKPLVGSKKKDTSTGRKQRQHNATEALDGGAATNFLALDKPLPGRAFLEVVHFPFASGERETEPLLDLEGNPLPLGPRLCYDLEWLSIIRAAHSHFPNHKGGAKLLPQIHANTIKKHRDWIVKERLGGDPFNWQALEIKRSLFVQSAATYTEGAEPIRVGPGVGPQADVFLDWLELEKHALAGTVPVQLHPNKQRQILASTSAAPSSSLGPSTNGAEASSASIENL